MEEGKKLRREFDFMRMDSCVSSPQVDILQSFDSQDILSFCDRLNDEDLNPNYEYADRNFSTLLHLSVANGHQQFTKELLRNKKTNPNQNHKVLQKYPLHVAVERGDVESVYSLLQAGADVNAKMADGGTALHIAALRSGAKFVKEGEAAQAEMQKKFSRIMSLLLSAGPVNVDAKNNTSGATPLYFAVDKGTEDCARQLILKGACVNIEVDGETVEEKIEESMPGLLSLGLDFNREDNDAIENQLFHCLYMDPSGDSFIEKWNEASNNNNVTVDVNADNGMYTFLQYASDQGAEKLVEFLLAKNANPNRCSKNYRIPPIVLAGHHGYFKVIKAFLKSHSSVDFTARDNKGENVLHRCVKRESKTSIQNEYRDYDLCLDLLLDDKKGVRKAILPAVNATDQMGNTPLHFAAFLGNEHAIRKLLRAESNIGIKNKKSERAISFISPSILEEFLDNCLQDYGLITDEHFQLEFKYSFLGPPHCQSDQQHLIKEDGDTSLNAWELKEKLTTTEMNDEQAESSFQQDLPEAEPLWYLAQTQHRHLLSHPIITSFLCLKWRRIRAYYYANLLFYVLFLSCLTSYLVLGAIHKDDQIGLRMTTLVCTCLLILRESFQALVSPRRYFFNIENWLEILMLTFSVYLTKSPLDIQNHYHRITAAVVVLCSWMEGFLLLGRHPKLSTFIQMFFTVSLKFLMFLAWYISIIIAFGFAFFFILSQQDGNDYFKNPEKSMLKTVVMSLTGELEFEGIDFGGPDAVFGKLVFLSYIFFIMLVLVNLLNGLAVSDITQIQKEAEILSYVSRVELIVFIESMLLGDPFHFLTNWPPFAWGRKMPACDCFSKIYKLGPIRWILTHTMGSTLLFNGRLMNKKAVFLPNQSRREQSKLPGPDGLGEDRRTPKDDNLILDDEIIESAKCLLVKKQETLASTKLKQMEKSLLLMNKQQNLIIEMLNNMNANSGS